MYNIYLRTTLKMSDLNNCMIICDSTPTRKKKASVTITKTQKGIRKTFYESPLRHIELSSKRWAQKHRGTQRKLGSNAKLALDNKRNLLSPPREDPLQDSIIILSDNEGESNKTKDKNKFKQQTRTKKRPLDKNINDKGGPQCNSPSKGKLGVNTPQRKRRKKDTPTLSKNNSSCLLTSDTEDSEITTIALDDENTAPILDIVNQGSDDIVVVWSSTKPSGNQMKEKHTISPEGRSKEKIPISPKNRSKEKILISSKHRSREKISLEPKNRSREKKSVSPENQLKEKISAPPGNQLKDNASSLLSGDQLKEKTPISSKGQSKEKTPEQEKVNRIFMIDRTPNPNNLSVLELDEEVTDQQCEPKIIKDVTKNKKENNVKEDPVHLPFSEHGIKLPKPHNISNQIVMVKPKPHHRLRDWRLQLPNYSTRLSNYNLSTVPILIPVCGGETTHEPSRSQELSSSGVSRSEQYRPESPTSSPGPSDHVKLREIIIDGNNVAMAHTNGRAFSVEGLKIVIDYFKRRGHSVKAFVPQHRRSLNHQLLEKLYLDGTVIFTPSRNIAGRRITPYDDRYILEYATMCKGIVVSLDQYRDLYMEKPEWRDTIANRLLAPTFVGNIVMFPEDPLGRTGPTLDEFLSY